MSAELQHPVYVVQRHDATSMHFDLRLEVDGVLVSWAVPKGPSTDPADKRLAVKVDDHELSYATFEGVIGRESDGTRRYGTGSVIVWDLGTFENITTHDGAAISAAAAIDRGHLVVDVHGQKVGGGFSLTRTKMSGRGENWLLVKVDDAHADRRRKPAVTQLESVLSGRTNDEVAAEVRTRPPDRGTS